MTTPEQQTLIAKTWQQVCFHLDGLAIGTSVECVDHAGGFGPLLSAKSPIILGELADLTGLRPGYLNLIFRLLELQGYVARSGGVADGAPSIAMTDAGRAWSENHEVYAGFRARVEAALQIHRRAEIALPDVSVAATEGIPDRIRDHLQGPVAAATMTALARAQIFTDGREDVACEALPHETAPEVLRGLGWGVVRDGRLSLTEAGRLALSFAAQYFYPVSYLPMLAAVPDMLSGSPSNTLMREDDGTESHVDRELDIAFSGIVFARTCREPLFELVLPMFDREPLETQPQAIVDCGGGDGTLLCELYAAIAARTRRGAHLSTHPLTMVGVEYNPVAEQVLAERLATAGVPGFVFAGDVGAPAAISEHLSAAGFPPDNVLHVSKSVFHNRSFARRRGNDMQSWSGTSSGGFVAPDGGCLTATEIEADLEGLFRDWRKVIGRHGMVVIEAHIIAAALAVERLGRSVMTSLEASHGFSHQYLLEIEAHRAAARRAGLRALKAHDFGTPFMGAPIMSIDHYAG